MNEAVWSVGALTRKIRDLLEIEMERVWVQGEITGWKVQRPSGHAYFALKDERALLNCVLWAPNVRRLQWEPRDGARVRALGGITVYEPRGSYQLKVEQLQLDGEGELQARFLALKRKLEAEGLFDPARKRPLPPLPGRIGIVTSASGAAVRDFLRVVGNRWPLAEVILRPAAVQGAGAAAEIAQALADLDRFGRCDVLVVARGGGSLEDLWAFNEEVVARAIATASAPVVSAVGHEVDFTIADFVADVRAATPSNAAELLVPDQEEMRARLRRDARALRLTAEGAISGAALRVARLRQARGLRRPEEMLHLRSQDLDRVAERLRNALSGRIDLARRRLSALQTGLDRRSPAVRCAEASARLRAARLGWTRGGEETLRRVRARLELARAQLSALSPDAVLERGYGIVSDADGGAIVRDPMQVDPGARVNVRLARGRLVCQVDERVATESSAGGESS